MKVIKLWKQGGYREFVETKLADGIHPTEETGREWVREVAGVMGEEMDMRDEMEVGPEEYVEDGRGCRYGEVKHGGNCRWTMLDCE